MKRDLSNFKSFILGGLLADHENGSVGQFNKLLKEGWVIEHYSPLEGHTREFFQILFILKKEKKASQLLKIILFQQDSYNNGLFGKNYYGEHDAVNNEFIDFYNRGYKIKEFLTLNKIETKSIKANPPNFGGLMVIFEKDKPLSNINID